MEILKYMTQGLSPNNMNKETIITLLLNLAILLSIVIGILLIAASMVVFSILLDSYCFGK
jgi:hypothetical protein